MTPADNSADIDRFIGIFSASFCLFVILPEIIHWIARYL
jgi:hypothetical protein